MRVRHATGNTAASGWDHVHTVHKKNNAGVWEVVKYTAEKESTGWRTVHVHYDRNEIVLSTNTSQFNVKDYVTNTLSMDPSSNLQHITIRVNPGVIVGSASASIPAINCTGFTSKNVNQDNLKHLVKIENHGKIYGAGGNTGTGGKVGSVGGNGGDAILFDDGTHLYIQNYGNIVGGGGGGGGGGDSADRNDAALVGGNGGRGAGIQSYDSLNNAFTLVEGSNTNAGVSKSDVTLTDGGTGGRIGQYGKGAGSSTRRLSNIKNAGQGGNPGTTIKGAGSSKLTFISNTHNETGHLYNLSGSGSISVDSTHFTSGVSEV